MLEQYNNLDISFQEDNIRFRTLNIAFETLQRIIPSHSHGEDSYEIHYVPSGEGIVGRPPEGLPDYSPAPCTWWAPHVPPRADFHAQQPHGRLLHLPADGKKRRLPPGIPGESPPFSSKKISGSVPAPTGSGKFWNPFLKNCAGSPSATPPAWRLCCGS